MAGEAVGINLPSYDLSATAVTERNAEYPDTPFTDIDGDGDYNTYLGCNRAGSCAPGIGIGTGFVLYETATDADEAKEWTVEDQFENPRTPQKSSHIGGINAAEDITVQPTFTPAETPINNIVDPNGTPDFNDTAFYQAALAIAAPGVGIGAGNTDPINRTNVTVQIGEVIWATNTVA